MSTTWIRTVQSGLVWVSYASQIAVIPTGSTLLRCHFGWGFYGDTASSTDLGAVSQNLQVMGLVTVVGGVGESPPNARTQSNDQDPPSQRWIYWESRAPRLTAIDSAGDAAYWQDSGAQQAVDTKGMVSAKSVPSGQQMALWASWAAAEDWDTTGSVNLWYWASVLYESPD